MTGSCQTVVDLLELDADLGPSVIQRLAGLEQKGDAVPTEPGGRGEEAASARVVKADTSHLRV